MEPKTIVMIAGEASGDLHGAHVVQALKKRQSNLFICGMGSQAMKAAGAKVVISADELSVVGITEVFSKLPQIIKAMRRLKHLLTSLKPDLLILIDFPDFNLHLAAIAKKLGIPVLYYISPQIWAWRQERVKK
ncbi:MAG: lipid-A-disaccharide synthase, partial [Desulfobacteraceae bacterium]|nr:lipid-A-disaccharide synthase [Desulfobacteraceae bacterium]